MTRVHPPRRLSSATHAPPGCLIRDLSPAEEIDSDYGSFTVRLPDGSGWHATGSSSGLGPALDGDGEGWPWKWALVNKCEVLEENLTRDECLVILSMPRDELEARYSTPPQDAAARPWVIGVGVFVTHANPGGYPRVSLRNVNIDVVIDWVRRDPRVGDLLREYEAAATARGPAAVAVLVAEGKRFLGALPVRKALALIDALTEARTRPASVTWIKIPRTS